MELDVYSARLPRLSLLASTPPLCLRPSLWGSCPSPLATSSTPVIQFVLVRSANIQHTVCCSMCPVKGGIRATMRNLDRFAIVALSLLHPVLASNCKWLQLRNLVMTPLLLYLPHGILM